MPITNLRNDVTTPHISLDVFLEPPPDSCVEENERLDFLLGLMPACSDLPNRFFARRVFDNAGQIVLVENHLSLINDLVLILNRKINISPSRLPHRFS